MNKVFVLLGGNLGDRKKNLSIAAALISERIGTIEICSSIYETEAWGMNDQPAFFNQVLLVNTPKKPSEFLKIILAIENEMGRKRDKKWAERIIDIDILFFNEEIINEEALIVPHPFIQDRRFTLVPMNEVAPNFVHPIFGATIKELLFNCVDVLKTKKIEI